MISTGAARSIARRPVPADQFGMAAHMPPMTVVNWRALALRRLAHLDELKRSGRWQRHFASEAAFEQTLAEAAADAEKWKRLAYQSEASRQAAE
jgi:hypothetical protein